MRAELLKYIITVDEYHSISKASAVLYMSQAALSKSISLFEEELNVSIFDRSNQGVTTTEAGSKIIEQAKIILKDYETLFQISAQSPAKIDYSETITFGLTEKFSNPTLSESMNKAMKKYPNLTFNALDLNFEKCLEQVSQQKIDLALIAFSGVDRNEFLDQLHQLSLRHIPLGFDPIYLLVNKLSPVAKKKLPTPIDLKDETFISYSTFDAIPEMTAKKIIRLSNFNSILQMVMDNMGISLLPYSILKQHESDLNDNVIVIPFETTQSNCIIYSSKKTLSPVQKFFIDLYTQTYRNTMSN